MIHKPIAGVRALDDSLNKIKLILLAGGGRGDHPGKDNWLELPRHCGSPSPGDSFNHSLAVTTLASRGLNLLRTLSLESPQNSSLYSLQIDETRLECVNIAY